MKKALRLLFFLLMLFLCSHNLFSQERLGIAGSNYAGSQGIMINPSNILNSKLYMDINLFSVNLSAQNNYFYIPAKDYSFGSFIREIDRNIKYNNDEGTWMDYESMNFREKSYNKGDNPNALVNLSIMGPSVMYAMDEQAFGIYSSVRSYATARNLPYEQMNFAYVDLNYLSQLSMDYMDFDYNITAASWLELGFTYARLIKETYNKHISGGITLKKLWSYAGSFAEFEKMDYRMEANGHAFIEDSDFQFAYAFPIQYSTNTVSDNIKPLGKGFGIDVGFTYQIKTRSYEGNKYSKVCVQKFEPYHLKVGVSILDIGSIKYKNNARLHHYYGPLEWENIHEFEISSITQLSQELSTRYFGNNAASLVDTTFKIGLPAALSIQSDYHYRDNIYLGGLFMLPLKFSKHQLRRAGILAFIPRYESDRFEISSPFLFYDFYEFRLGLSLRYGFLTLGTDKLGAFFGMSNFDGIDFYMMIKFNFIKGKCSNKYLDVCEQ